eukprot:SAG31_NODE_52_length_30366_cov_34.368586_7_plen_802_part_00
MDACLLARDFASAPALLQLASTFTTSTSGQAKVEQPMAIADNPVAAALLWTDATFWKAAAADAVKQEASGISGAAAVLLQCVVEHCRLDSTEALSVAAPIPLQLPITTAIVDQVVVAVCHSASCYSDRTDDVVGESSTHPYISTVQKKLRARVSATNAPRLRKLQMQLVAIETELKTAIKQQQPMKTIKKLQSRAKELKGHVARLELLVLPSDNDLRIMTTTSTTRSSLSSRSNARSKSSEKDTSDGRSPIAGLRKWVAKREEEKRQRENRSNAALKLQAHWRGCSWRRYTAAKRLQASVRGWQVRASQRAMRDGILSWLATIPIGHGGASMSCRRYDPTHLLRFGLANMSGCGPVDPEQIYTLFLQQQARDAEVQLHASDYVGRRFRVVAPQVRLAPTAKLVPSTLAHAIEGDCVSFGTELEVIAVRRRHRAVLPGSASDDWLWCVARQQGNFSGWINPFMMGCCGNLPASKTAIVPCPQGTVFYRAVKPCKLRSGVSLTSSSIGTVRSGELVEVAAMTLFSAPRAAAGKHVAHSTMAQRVKCFRASSSDAGWGSIRARNGCPLLELVPTHETKAASDELVAAIVVSMVDKVAAAALIQQVWRRHFWSQSQRLKRAKRQADAAASAATAAEQHSCHLTAVLVRMTQELRLARARAANAELALRRAEDDKTDCEIDNQSLREALAQTTTHQAKREHGWDVVRTELCTALDQEKALVAMLKSAMSCPICFELYGDSRSSKVTPKFLAACGHTVCEGCLDKILHPRLSLDCSKNKRLKCPLCNATNLVHQGVASSLQTNFAVT